MNISGEEFFGPPPHTTCPGWLAHPVGDGTPASHGRIQFRIDLHRIVTVSSQLVHTFLLE